MIQNQIKKVLIFLLILGTKNVLAHPLHVTVSNIVISNDSVYVSVLLDGHDLEHAIEADGSKFILYENLESNKAMLEFVRAYMAKNFSIVFDDINVLLHKWICSIENDKVKLVIDKKIESAPYEITIANTLLLNTHGEVRNLLILSANNFERGIEFNSVDTKKTITLVK